MNLTPKRLKIVQKGYEGYNGPIGEYEFVDGISTETIPLNVRDRLAAAFQMVEIDEDGTELAASVADRLVRDRANVIERTAPLKRMSDEDKAEENIAVLLGKEKLKPLLNREALEAAAADGGIAAVRKLAEPWNVKSKSIPELIAMIEKAQADYRADRMEVLTRKGANKADLEKLFELKGVEVPVKAAPKKTEPTEPAPATPALNEAAATGDLAAALNAE